jgi:hypothetical protein
VDSDHPLVDLYQDISSVCIPSEEPRSANYPLSSGTASRGCFRSPSSRRSPIQSTRSSSLSVAPSSTTPGRRRIKSPTPEITPTRLRQHISMTTGVSPSILGPQRSRKPSPPPPRRSKCSDEHSPVSAQDELVPEEKPHNVPAITVDPASAYALPMQTPQTYWDQPFMRHFPQLDPYRHSTIPHGRQCSRSWTLPSS